MYSEQKKVLVKVPHRMLCLSIVIENCDWMANILYSDLVDSKAASIMATLNIDDGENSALHYLFLSITHTGSLRFPQGNCPNLGTRTVQAC